MLWKQGQKFTTSDGVVVVNITMKSIIAQQQQSSLGIIQRRLLPSNPTPNYGSGVVLPPIDTSVTFSSDFSDDFK